VQVRCIKATTITKTEKPLVSYLTGQHVGRVIRAKLLKEVYQFTCECEICEWEEKHGDVIRYSKLEKRIIQLGGFISEKRKEGKNRGGN
jgi:plasmid rolling circle replication initiator protein Rep